MDIVNELKIYRQEIVKVIEIFKDKYSTHNPIYLWKKGKIDRVNILKVEDSTIEFSLHGSGVTVEKNNIIISFEIINNEVISNSFKFKMYLETKFNTEVKDEDILKVLNKDIIIDWNPSPS